MAIAFDGIAFGHAHAAGLRHAADIVAAQIEQHQVFGAFLGIGEQARLVGAVFFGGMTARASPGDRANGDFAVADAHEDFRARPDQCKAGQIEEIEEGRRVDPPQ